MLNEGYGIITTIMKANQLRLKSHMEWSQLP